MKKIYSTLKLILPILFLFGCSGGGGSSGDSSGGGGTTPPPPTIAYVGLTTPATITESNSEDMVFGSLLGVETGGYFALSAESQDKQFPSKQSGTVPNHPNVIDLPLVLKSTSKNISFYTPKRYPLSAAVSAVRTSTEVINGNCGGTATYTLNINDVTGTYDGTFIFSQFCEDGIVISGDTNINGTVNLATAEILTVTYVFENLTVDDFIYKGDVFVNDAVTPQIITLDLLAKDSASDKVYWAKDYSLIITEINATDVEIEVTGTYYDPDQGYVTVSTPEPLLVSTEDWPIFGILLCVGDKNAKARLTAINNYSYRIDTDTNGDDAYDFSTGVLIWPGASAPSPQIWTPRASLPTALGDFATCTAGDKIYAIGGYIINVGEVTNVIEEYNPDMDIWLTKSPMQNARQWFAVGVVNNKIYAIGGLDSNNTLTGAVEEYDPVADSWTTKSSMSVPRSLSSAAVFNGKIYVFGGSEANGIISATVEEYNPGTDTWSVKASMPTARYGLAASTANGKIYAIGGYYDLPLSTGPTDIIEEYDPLTDIWNTVASMPTKRYNLSSVSVNEEIFAIGGQSGGTLNVVEKYSPSTNSWLTKTPMPHGGGGSFASVLNNKIFVVGIGDFTKVYEYDPLLDL